MRLVPVKPTALPEAGERACIACEIVPADLFRQNYKKDEDEQALSGYERGHDVRHKDELLNEEQDVENPRYSHYYHKRQCGPDPVPVYVVHILPWWEVDLTSCMKAYLASASFVLSGSLF